MSVEIDRLRPFFPDLEDAHLARLAALAEIVHFPAGSEVIREGKPADACFALLAGDVALSVFAPGKSDLLLETLQPGELLGWSWLFPPYRWAFDGRAVAEVEAIRLDGPALREAVDADPAFGVQLVKRIAALVIQRLQQARVHRMDLYAGRG